MVLARDLEKERRRGGLRATDVDYRSSGSVPCTDRVWRPRGIICFPVILCQRKTDGRQIRNPSARDLPDLKTGSSVRGSVSSRERRNTWSGFRLAASFRRERCESKLKMQWRWAWINLVILWSSDRGKPNRLKETNGTHRRSRRETGDSILRGQRRLPRRMPGGSVLGSRPESDTF